MILQLKPIRVKHNHTRLAQLREEILLVVNQLETCQDQETIHLQTKEMVLVLNLEVKINRLLVIHQVQGNMTQLLTLLEIEHKVIKLVMKGEKILVVNQQEIFLDLEIIQSKVCLEKPHLVLLLVEDNKKLCF
jgi:hypothetical protein